MFGFFVVVFSLGLLATKSYRRVCLLWWKLLRPSDPAPDPRVSHPRTCPSWDPYDRIIFQANTKRPHTCRLLPPVKLYGPQHTDCSAAVHVALSRRRVRALKAEWRSLCFFPERQAFNPQCSIRACIRMVASPGTSAPRKSGARACPTRPRPSSTFKLILHADISLIIHHSYAGPWATSL
jgi:hypothetical protein